MSNVPYIIRDTENDEKKSFNFSSGFKGAVIKVVEEEDSKNNTTNVTSKKNKPKSSSRAETAKNSKLETTEPYEESYGETKNVLRITINQLEDVSHVVRDEIETVKNSRTLKGKYKYIPELASTLGSLLNTKITAIRELNKVTTDAHNLELKRIKDLKLTEDKKDDDKSIMDTYNAFISMPGSSQFRLPSNELTSMHTSFGGINSSVGMDEINRPQLNAQDMRMRYEHDPNIETVVMYDMDTGRKWFDVINMQTKMSINGVERPDPMFLDSLIIEPSSGIARDKNLDRTYKLITMGKEVDKY